MRYETAFRDGAAGQEPEGWTRRWGMVASVALSQYDVAPVVHQTFVDEEPALFVRTSHASATTYGALTLDAVDSDADRADVDIRALVSLVTSGSIVLATHPVLIARQSGAAASETGYALELNDTAHEISLAKLVAGTRTQLGAAVASSDVYTNRLVWVRFQVLNTGGSATQKGKVWAYDDTEPAAWNVERADTAISAAGGVGIATHDSHVRYVRYIAIGTGGDEPLEFSAFGPSLAELSRSRGEALEYTLELESRDTAADTVGSEFHSTHLRNTDGTDLPVSEAFTALLQVPESVSRVMAADFDFGEDIGQLATLTLKNTPRNVGEAGPLDHWNGKSFEGRQAILRVGRVGAKHRSFTRLVTGTVRGEPEIGSESATVTLESALGAALRRPLDVRRYIGIRTGLRSLTVGGGTITQPHVVDYNVTAGTIVLRFRQPDASAINSRLASKQVSATDRNFRLSIQTGGNVTALWSEGGVSKTIHDTGSLLVNDGELHTYVWSFIGGQRSYLMIDGEVVAENDAIGTPDVQTADLVWSENSPVNAERFDGRLYSVYMEPALARSVTAQRVTGDSHPSLIALLQMDDGAGTTAADQSVTNNDGTVSGVEDTNFEWFPTDQGDASWAGKPMPVAYGNPRNVPTDSIDKPIERYRINDGELVQSGATVVDWDPARSQGVERVWGVNYTDEGDGVISFDPNLQSEPVTSDTLYISGDSRHLYPPQIVTDLLMERGGFPTTFQTGTVANSDEIDHDSAAAFLNALSYRGGWHSKSGTPAITEVLQQILRSIGGHYRQDRYGRFVVDTLRPPMGAGPYGKWLELVGVQIDDGRGRLIWNGLTVPAGSRTVAMWVRSYTTKVDNAAVESFTGLSTLLNVGAATLEIDRDTGQASFDVSGVDTLLSPQTIPIGRDVFLAGTYDATGNEMKLYVGFRGETLKLVATLSVSGTAAAGTSVALSGVGAVAGLQAWDSALSLSALEDLFEATSPPDGSESGIVAIAPLTEGSGPLAYELVSGVGAPIRGARWCPRLTLDLTAGNSGLTWSRALRTLKPASRVTLNFDRNWRPLGPTEIAGTVTDPDKRSALLNEWQSVDAFDQAVADDYLAARELVFNTVLRRRNDASRVLELFQDRLQPGRRFGELRMGSTQEPDHRALALQPGDEVRITDYRYGLESGWHARVLGSTFSRGSLSLGVWG